MNQIFETFNATSDDYNFLQHRTNILDDKHNELKNLNNTLIELLKHLRYDK